MTKNIEGKERFTEELERMKTVQMSKQILHQVVSHGKEGAVNGIMKMLDGRQYAFSDFYRFHTFYSFVNEHLSATKSNQQD